jgi:SAM-dependent methyltransferase
VWAGLEISDERVAKLYRARYFCGEEYTDYVSDRASLEANFNARLTTLERFLDAKRHRRLFELGCAYGFFLNLARQRFATAEGFDVSADAVRYARDVVGVNATAGDVRQVDFGERRFDVACLWDTVEHLSEPDEHLAAIAARMDAGAIVALTTGDIGSLNARLRRERWRLIHPPTHIHYFTTTSIGRLLDRLGFDVCHVEHCSSCRSVGSMLDGVLRLGQRWPAVAGMVKRQRWAHVGVTLNIGDIMYVIGRKRPA